ncbi:cytochrome c [Pseudoruegeria sp. HB172150]|uniref:cytochrome c n=1 Tax=Pseudoruegeria sp. HB172150 TaxID=2721164 RepID=UPI0015553181|nr:cytochrome c [Pseudoruegeria sp. HB172150]
MRFVPALMIACLAAPVLGQDLGSGERNFAIHCAGCHGEDAKGGGIASMILDGEAPDLTKLAERNGGVFPRAAVVFQIDGRDPLPGHAGEMPQFGPLFEGETAALKTAAGQPVVTSKAIVELVEWLEARQE